MEADKGIKLIDSNKTAKLKICVLGSGNVGKTSLTYKYINYNTPSEHDSTIEDKYKTVVEISGVTCEIDILDTAGQDDYQSLLDNWINFADGFLLVFAINDKDSLSRIEKLQGRIMKIKKDKCPIVIAGNKCDLTSGRVVSEFELNELAKLWGASYIETSAEVYINHNIDRYKL